MGSVLLKENKRLEIRTRYKDGKSGIIFFTELLNVLESVFESYHLGEELQKLAMRIPYWSNVEKQEMMISFQECKEKHRAGLKSIQVGAELVLLDLLIPDVTLGHIENIDASSIEVGKMVGEGKFGQVFAGKWKNEVIAIKCPKLPSGEELENVTRDFVREADLMSRLNDVHLVRLHGVSALEISKIPCLIMEFIPHGDLATDFHYLDETLLLEYKAARRPEKIAKLLKTIAECQTMGKSSETIKQELQALNASVHNAGESAQWSMEFLTAEQVRCSQLHAALVAGVRPRLLQSDRRLPPEVRLRLMHDVAAALAFLHSQRPPLVHNDVRSPNVFLLQVSHTHTRTNVTHTHTHKKKHSTLTQAHHTTPRTPTHKEYSDMPGEQLGAAGGEAG